MGKLSRNVPLRKNKSVLLIVDVQNFCCTREGGEYQGLTPEEFEKHDYFFKRLQNEVLPNIKKIQTAFRNADMEVMFTVIESLTEDGRDRGLDYKITGFNVPKGSPDAKVVKEIEPFHDEIIIPKTSSSVFNSTNIDYVLRNLNCRHLVVCGVVTDQCVESAVRDACDLNYLVTLVPDACATITPERHINSLNAIKGYCRQVSTDDLVHEIHTHIEQEKKQ
ncbi:cysteine hydrolase family protein [Desulfospira joergensenii]|uniref:cysteine hydrolase family protein n=1 Tax=Desulfospira joergensenii TaxID=53329 RepID=UPI0003B71E61|nr:isochorismatase family cysteine hydrolase [Desulfospira joergensenii]